MRFSWFIVPPIVVSCAIVAVRIPSPVFADGANSPEFVTGLTWTPTSPEIGEQVNFAVTGHTGDIRVEWDFGDDGCYGYSQIMICEPFFSDCHDMFYKFASPGDKNVSITVRDPSTGVLLGSTSQTITVLNQGSCVDFEWAPDSPTIGTYVGFNVTGVPASEIEQAVWNFGGTGCDGSTTYTCVEPNFPGCNQAAHVYMSGGTKAVRLTVTTAGGVVQPEVQHALTVQNNGSCSDPPGPQWPWSLDKKVVPTAGDSNGLFGQSIDTDGASIVVGRPGGIGLAYIFRSNAGGEWQGVEEIVLPTPVQAVGFGRSVAIQGRFAVVGGHLSDICGSLLGAAWIFRDTSVAGDWSNVVQTIICPTIGTSPGMHFGVDVAIHGRNLVVGASQDETNGPESGAVFLFQDTSVANDWSSLTETKIVASDGQADDFFGHSVSIQDRTLVVGAYSAEHSGNESGTAYIFADLTPTGGWQTIWETVIIPAEPMPYDRFGWDVAVDGDTVVVGAPFRYTGNYLEGSIFVFQDQSGSGNWTTYSETEIEAPQGSDWDEFGFAVAIEGDLIAVGAPLGDSGGPVDSGTVTYIWDISPEGDWTEIDDVTTWTFDAVTGDEVGRSIALKSPLAAVGAPNDTNQNGQFSGAVYLSVDEAAIGNNVFSDSFESGDTSAWSGVAP